MNAESNAISYSQTVLYFRLAIISRSNNDPSKLIELSSLNSYIAAKSLSEIDRMYQIPQLEIDRYQKESESYLQAYKNYLQMERSFQRFFKLSGSLEIQVINSGNVPAIGCIIRLEFPENLRIVDYDKFPASSIKRNRPTKPRNLLDLLQTRQNFMVPFSVMGSSSPSTYAKFAQTDNYGANITGKNGTAVEWVRSKIMHHIPLSLTKLVVTFPEKVGDFEYYIDYQIHSDNLSVPVEGKLQITVHIDNAIIVKSNGN